MQGKPLNLDIEEIIKLQSQGLSIQQIADNLGVSYSSIYRRVNNLDQKVKTDNVNLETIDDKFTEEELKVIKDLSKLSEGERRLIIQNYKHPQTVRTTYDHSFGGNKIKIGYITDLHIGSKFFDEKLFEKSVKIFKQEGVDIIYCGGDIIEGMSNREGHMFELKKLGVTNQVKEAENFIKNYHTKVYGITGNHELWAKRKSNQGIDAGDYLENISNNYVNLGQMEADIDLGGIVLKLYHGQDGSAYAPGYRGAKLIESLSGGQKPNILLSGHTHKYLYMFQRNIHYLEGGCMQSQTDWMRGKKLMAHKGFSIIDLDFGNGGVDYFNLRFYPAYD